MTTRRQSSGGQGVQCAARRAVQRGRGLVTRVRGVPLVGEAVYCAGPV